MIPDTPYNAEFFPNTTRGVVLSYTTKCCRGGIAIFGAAGIVTTPTDILPDINILIVSVIWILVS